MISSDVEHFLVCSLFVSISFFVVVDFLDILGQFFEVSVGMCLTSLGEAFYQKSRLSCVQNSFLFCLLDPQGFVLSYLGFKLYLVLEYLN